MLVNCLKTAHEPFINYNNNQLRNKSVTELSQKSVTRASSHVADFNTRNKWLTQKLLVQGYRYHKT